MVSLNQQWQSFDVNVCRLPQNSCYEEDQGGSLGFPLQWQSNSAQVDAEAISVEPRDLDGAIYSNLYFFL